MSDSPDTNSHGAGPADPLAIDDAIALLEKAQEVAHIGSWVAELDGSRRLGWSRETYRIFGVPQGGFEGTVDAFFGFVHPDDLANVRSWAARAIAEKRGDDLEHRITRADADVRWVHERADVVLNASGEAVRLVGTIQDITERRALEEQLRQSQKLEAIGRLAGGVAHDLNNALTAIVGYTELALAGLAANDPVRPDVMEIRRAAERAESVTRQLLAFSRKQVLQPRVFAVNESVSNVGRLLGRLLGTDVRLRTTLGENVPPIYGDLGQIEQAILNLAVNARDAMPTGGTLTLRVAVVDVDEAFARAHQPMPAGKYVELSVADTGEGMSPDIQAHVFEPFFTTKATGKGTGLGLAMVYGTVKQSGGYIFVESEVGRGTTFRLYFPPAAPAPVPQAVEPSATTGATVLVAEDDAAIRSLVVTALGRQGYRVLHAGSGEAALALAAEEPSIDLLLTDANMPGMSGIELARAVAATHPGVRIVVMSGYTDGPVTVEGAARVSLLQKPFTPKELREKARVAIEDQG